MDAKRILVIDDDVELCEEMGELLRDEGYFVEHSSRSEQAEKLIKNNAYDIVLLDFKMPGLNGIEMSKKIRSKHPEVRIYMITGRPHIDLLLKEENAAELVDGVIAKPFDHKILLEKLK